MAEQRYYAHPQNRFWHLVGQVIGRDLQSLDYEERLQILREHHLGLWDTVATARREGSLDAAIRGASYNSLAELVSTLPELHAVGFNGATSAKIGMKQLSEAGLALVLLPSSSPAFAAMPLAEKEHRWLQLRKFLS